MDAQNEAVIKRLKELLGQQRERLRSYLDVLEKQRAIIGTHRASESERRFPSGSSGEKDILAYNEIEERIVADIFSIQKAIDPLETMSQASPDDGVLALKAELEGLSNEAAAQSRRNRDLISARMAEIRGEIDTARANSLAVGGRRSMYQSINTASLIDIEG